MELLRIQRKSCEKLAIFFGAWTRRGSFLPPRFGLEIFLKLFWSKMVADGTSLVEIRISGRHFGTNLGQEWPHWDHFYPKSDPTGTTFIQKVTILGPLFYQSYHFHNFFHVSTRFFMETAAQVSTRQRRISCSIREFCLQILSFSPRMV